MVPWGAERLNRKRCTAGPGSIPAGIYALASAGVNFITKQSRISGQLRKAGYSADDEDLHYRSNIVSMCSSSEEPYQETINPQIIF